MQEVIVYRSPAEVLFWQNLPSFALCFAFAIFAMWIAAKIDSKYGRKLPDWTHKLFIVVIIAAAIIGFWLPVHFGITGF